MCHMCLLDKCKTCVVISRVRCLLTSCASWKLACKDVCLFERAATQREVEGQVLKLYVQIQLWGKYVFTLHLHLSSITIYVLKLGVYDLAHDPGSDAWKCSSRLAAHLAVTGRLAHLVAIIGIFDQSNDRLG